MVTGRLNTPLEVLIITSRTIPSLPGCVSWMTAVGHCKFEVLSSDQDLGSQGVGWVLFSAIADAVVGSEDNP